MNKKELRKFVRKCISEELDKREKEKANEAITETDVSKNHNEILYISIIPDVTGGKFLQDPYFKFGPDKIFNKCCRISMKDSHYIVHYNYSLEMSKKTIDKLISLLNAPSTSDKHVNKTVWEALIDQIIEFFNLEGNDAIELKNSLSVMPDYHNITFLDKDKNCKKERW